MAMPTPMQRASDRSAMPAPGPGEAIVLPMAACLLVGVTAHRDLVAGEVPALEAAVDAFLRKMQGLHADLPVAVMSGLAEGGDRLVARCALALGLPLVAPLPLPLEDYRRDCTSPESEAEFDALLARAQVIHLPLAEGNDAVAVALPGPARNRQYAQLGVFISSHCQVLLALWDGTASEAVGGTSDVVHFHLHGEMTGLGRGDGPPNLLADDDSDLAFHIVCSRARSPAPAEGSLGTYWLTRGGRSAGSGAMPGGYVRLFDQLGEFNADARLYAEAIEREGHGLLPPPEIAPARGSLLRIDALYRRADWLALHFRQRVHRSMALLHVLAVLTGLLLMTYAEFVTHPLLMGAILGLFALGAAVAWLGNRRCWHRRYLDYRVLAEGLRVQAYWAVASVPSSQRVGFAYDSFLQKQDVELGWIRHAMRAVALGGERRANDAGLQWVIAHWVGDGGTHGQLGYFRRRATDRERMYRHTRLLGRASLLLSLAGAIVLVVFGTGFDAMTVKLLLVTTGVAALFAGVREAYSYKLADKELIKQYRFMARVFGAAADRLARDPTPAKQRQVLEALGEAALEEHAEWILMHRERPLEQQPLAGA
jgi:hypothetical protein